MMKLKLTKKQGCEFALVARAKAYNNQNKTQLLLLGKLGYG